MRVKLAGILQYHTHHAELLVLPPTLRSAVRRLLEEGKKKILLNLAGVGYIDSSGIGELVSSYTAINKEGGQLKLLSLTQKLRDLLTITKLLTVFDAYDDEAEALENFK